MPLFQEAIIKKHLSAIDDTIIDSAYSEYKRVYSPEKIKNIKVAKEEQYQEGFIKDVFGAVLGYSVYPESPFNIETERKNETNSKKADGAILKDEKVVGVIELKDNKTKNLDSVKDQAFGYKNNHKECSYVISSNFHKLRFYIDDATEYEEFDLYNLDKETFKRFYLYLRKEGLLDKNLPKLLRQETKFHEEEISKKLYKDYTGFKQSFFENAVKNNAQYDKLLLFKKSQKFLDRILFLLFAEDKGLVGTNSIVKIVEKWSEADDDYYRPLYEMVNTYFGHLYRGFTYQKTGEVIPQFGGELFAPDEVLDALTIDDAVLKNDLLVLSKYDFNTDVDVNILGHIFEHSLNEVDDVEASLRGETPDKAKSKRKKDGVFYTPKYITKYIVDNTLGKLCAEKKAAMKLDGDIAIFEYQKADGKLNEKGKELFDQLNAYKAWLITVKVCDPACGSGAFLNQALSFFIDEHGFVDDLVAELTNTPLRLFDTDLQILENNIYGVDINEESVEIAKLSLWLRTAQPGRKLSDLSANIKCGNSLIDDPAVAGDKAFNWQQEFPAVFEKGGFDVVIGNPPYVQIKKPDLYLRKLYNTIYCGDTYALFFEKAISIASIDAHISYITPSSFMTNIKFSGLRRFILDYDFLQLIDLGANVFKDASVDSAITIIRKSVAHNCVLLVGSSLNELRELDTRQFSTSSDFVFNIYSDSASKALCSRVENSCDKMSQFISFSRGLEFGFKSDFIHENRISIDYSPVICGGDIARNKINFNNKYFLFDPLNVSIYKDRSIYVEDKILVKRIGNRIVCCFDDRGYFNVCDVYNLQMKSVSNKIFHLKSISLLLNSRFINFYFDINFKSVKKLFPKIAIQQLKSLPFPKFDQDVNECLIEQHELLDELNSQIDKIVDGLVKYLNVDFEFGKFADKLFSWPNFSPAQFINLISRLKTQNGKSLSINDRFELVGLFEENKKKVLELKAEIDKTDREIDRMVYALYGLTEEEIRIVESA